MLCKLNIVFLIKIPKSKKEKLAQISFYCLGQEIWLGNLENLFAKTNQDSTVSYTQNNSKLFNLTLKYFSIFNNTPTES